MAKNALIEHRPWLLASVIAAGAYYFLWNNPIGEIYLIALKGAGVGLLAVYAGRRTSGADGSILVAALVLSAAADMALVLDMTLGGALFALSHIVATVLYLRNRRSETTRSQRLTAMALLVGAPVISYLLSQDIMIGIYALTLGAMAASAWSSRFPRYRVGLGAVLFVMSDWLIFSELGPFDLAPLPDLLIWPLYFAGQLMIATGVVQTLRGELPVR
ncbi:lysoplasmalogenase family protein [Erythrobacter sp. F6033]|uniref:lysoplasmalogenase family protein n=1 Tax=Erythrobacter sp. F6033 TaxID=2926401 RepID=UPI001FF4F311|nr:lysoplasmalogenase family protein [Erythrobacter sp. F6033]MCK0128336.1 lysoplasmalogenase [Erythrobacter sp. F6033]